MTTQNPQIDDCGCRNLEDPNHPIPVFCVNTEGTEHPWPGPLITSEEIAKLGGWDVGQGVIEVREDNSERTLGPGETVRLEPGRAYCRRVRWKRGLVRSERIAAELELLKSVYPDLEFRDGWVRIPNWPMPRGWSPEKTDIAFQIADTFPGAPPYGVFVPAGLRFNGAMPGGYGEPAGSQPPFGGTWGAFSWMVFDPGDWKPSVSVQKGVNLLRWVRGFSQRLAEGV